MNQDFNKPVLVIVGGGTAGWMAANYCHNQLKAHWQVVVIESDRIGTIGVGEGTTPYIRQFFASMGLQESEWMPACDATYKCGIRFPGWSTRKGFTSYYHPFFSALDLPHGDTFFEQANQRRYHHDAVASQPDHYFLASYLSSRGLSPASYSDPQTHIDYAYHFDAAKLGHYLRDVAKRRGVRHIQDTVEHVTCNAEGNIASLSTTGGDIIAADYFIDCTGFRGLLIEQTLHDPFMSFSDNLLNNAAVAVQTPLDANTVAPTETRSEALANGWIWQIPLTQRQGNGYVYSRDFCSADDAEMALREQLGLSDELSCRHLTMRVGRRTAHATKNCMAIGLSQGFIEPLEATALMLVQFSLQTFCAQLLQAGVTLATDTSRQQQINTTINRLFDGVRDYIVAHYKTNSRTDTEYWRVNREDTPVSDTLQAILSTWREGKPMEPVLNDHAASLVYLRPSWYCLLAGMDETGRYHNLDNSRIGKPDKKAIEAQAHYLSLCARFSRA